MKIAIVGASGIVGRALLEHLIAKNIDVTGYSRRPPAQLPNAKVIALDLLDKAACRAAAKDGLRDTTHIVYAALFEKPGLIAGWQQQDQMTTNLAMLQNLLEPLQTSNTLRHITLLQGTKAYGAHVAPMTIPGKEDAPRVPHENFYWLQQDYLADRCEALNWEYTIWRPQIVIGHALHAPMNMLAAIGVYAALQKAQGLPLHYPGGISAVTEAIDARLLAQAITFSLDRKAFKNHVFNITNGDVFRWQDLWPALAGGLGMVPGEPNKQHLSQHLYEQEALWSNIVTDNNLIPNTIASLVGDSFYYADALFNSYGNITPPPTLLSTIKLRQAGFSECIDTAEMFRYWFHRLAQLKVLPAIHNL